MFRRVFDLQVESTYRCLKKIITRIDIGYEKSVLDVGCGAMPYRQLFPLDCKYQGIDTFDSKEDFDYNRKDVLHFDGITFPVFDCSVDIVLHSEVIEHIYDTRHFLSECYRVLKKNGLMIITVPFQARFHYIPNDYWRFTPSAINKLLIETGFYDVRILNRGTDIVVAGYKVLTVGYRLFFSKSWWRMLVSILLTPLWMLSLIIGQIGIHYNIGSKDDCLGYVIVCKRN